MSYVYIIKNKGMIKKENFEPELQKLAGFARVLSHPARLAILKFLAETRTCISGDISDSIPLSRSTVSQHLKELRESRTTAKIKEWEGEVFKLGDDIIWGLTYRMLNKLLEILDEV